MAKEKELIALGAKLTRLGIAVENKRKMLRQLVEQGVPYESTQMLQALLEFQQADAEWKELEQKYISLHNEMVVNLDEIKPKEFKKLFEDISKGDKQESVIRGFLEPHFTDVISQRQVFELPSYDDISAAINGLLTSE